MIHSAFHLVRLLNISHFFHSFSSSFLSSFYLFYFTSQIFRGLTAPPPPPPLSYFTLCPVDSEGDQMQTSSTSRAPFRLASVFFSRCLELSCWIVAMTK